jgi:hypothetical protein
MSTSERILSISQCWSPNMSHLIPLTQKAFEEVSNENWAAVCTHVKKVEQDYTDKEPMLDGSVDEFILHVNTGSSDEGRRF